LFGKYKDTQYHLLHLLPYIYVFDITNGTLIRKFVFDADYLQTNNRKIKHLFHWNSKGNKIICNDELSSMCLTENSSDNGNEELYIRHLDCMYVVNSSNGSFIRKWSFPPIYKTIKSYDSKPLIKILEANNKIYMF